MTRIDIQEPVSAECAGGSIHFGPSGEVTVSAHSVPESKKKAPDLLLSNFVELWCSDDWACFVGERGKTVWFARPSMGVLTKATELDRLDLEDGYDPGGLHNIEFLQLPGGDLLIVYELGLVRIGSDGICRWQQVHDQLSAHINRVVDGIAWFQGEYEDFGFDLGDGHPVLAV